MPWICCSCPHCLWYWKARYDDHCCLLLFCVPKCFVTTDCQCMKVFYAIHNLTVVRQQTLVRLELLWVTELLRKGNVRTCTNFKSRTCCSWKGEVISSTSRICQPFTGSLFDCRPRLLQSTYLFHMPTMLWIWPSFCSFLLGSIQSCDKSPACWSCF